MLTLDDYEKHEIAEMKPGDLALASLIHQNAVASWAIDDSLKLNAKLAKHFKTTTKRLNRIFPQNLYIVGDEEVRLKIDRQKSSEKEES